MTAWNEGTNPVLNGQRGPLIDSTAHVHLLASVTNGNSLSLTKKNVSYSNNKAKLLTDVISSVLEETSDPESIKSLFTFESVKALPSSRTENNKLTQFDIIFKIDNEKNFKVVRDYLNTCLTRNIHKKTINDDIEDKDLQRVTFYPNTINASTMTTNGILFGLCPDFHGQNSSCVLKLHHSYWRSLTELIPKDHKYQSYMAFMADVGFRVF